MGGGTDETNRATETAVIRAVPGRAMDVAIGRVKTAVIRVVRGRAMDGVSGALETAVIRAVFGRAMDGVSRRLETAVIRPVLFEQIGRTGFGQVPLDASLIGQSPNGYWRRGVPPIGVHPRLGRGARDLACRAHTQGMQEACRFRPHVWTCQAPLKGLYLRGLRGAVVRGAGVACRRVRHVALDACLQGGA